MFEQPVLPTIKETGAPATVEISTRQSSRMPEVTNVRLTLPDRTMVVEFAGETQQLPRTPQEGQGMPVFQFGLVMN